jgi:hypothetical protein
MMAHQDNMMRSTYAKCWCWLPRQCDILVWLVPELHPNYDRMGVRIFFYDTLYHPQDPLRIEKRRSWNDQLEA